MGGKILIQVKYSTDIHKVWLGRVGKVSDGNYVVRHCPSPITAIVYTKNFDNKCCDWRRTMQCHTTQLPSPNLPTRGLTSHICIVSDAPLVSFHKTIVAWAKMARKTGSLVATTQWVWSSQCTFNNVPILFLNTTKQQWWKQICGNVLDT